MKIVPWIGLVSLFLGLYSCGGCNPAVSGQTSTRTTGSTTIEIRHAQGFTVQDGGHYKLVDISDPTGENTARYQYAFLNRGASAQGIPSEYTVIEVPVRNVICMTTLQLSNFIKLDAQDRVAGMPSTRFLFDETMKQRLANGSTRRIGIEGEFDPEVVIALDPDVILISPFKRGGYDALANLDIPMIAFLGYKEYTPLGQAEWIKFTGMLLGEEEQANEKFNDLESRYNELKTLAASVEQRPTVLSGELHSGNWYVVGGESYLAQLFRDAGADYFMKNNIETGGYYVDFETVYSQGANADYWRLVNSHNGPFDYETLEKSDARYTDFKALRDRKVIYCNLREKPFYEDTPVQPEVVLADLIRIFHPGLLPDHEPVFYDLLK